MTVRASDINLRVPSKNTESVDGAAQEICVNEHAALSPLNFELSSGRSISLEVWNFNRLQDYVRNNLDLTADTDGWHFVDGFDLISDGVLSTSYPKHERGFAQVVCFRDIMVGCAVCDYIEESPFLSFPHYFLRWVDVHRDWRNQGIGSQLLRSLELAPQLAGEVLAVSLFTEDGEAYLQPRIKELLPGMAMSIVPEDTFMAARPTTLGWIK